MFTVLCPLQISITTCHLLGIGTDPAVPYFLQVKSTCVCVPYILRGLVGRSAAGPDRGHTSARLGLRLRINELLNAPAAAVDGGGRQRVDMASLVHADARPAMSMSHIIHELQAARPPSRPQPAARPQAAAAVAPAEDPQPAAGPRGRMRPLTEAEKRVKQRMLVKKSYYRKIDTINELRGQVEELEQQFREVLRTSTPASTTVDGASAGLATAVDGLSTLRTRYTQLAIAQDELRRENEELRARAMDQSKMSTRVRILLDEEVKEQAAVREALKRVHRSPLPELPAPASPRPATPSTPPSPQCGFEDGALSVAGLSLRPLTPYECRHITDSVLADVQAFRAAQQSADTTGACVFGWRDRRRVDPDGRMLRFCLEKTFKNLTARELTRRMWALVSTERGLSQMYASARATRFYTLQRVDDSNVLFYREMRAAGPTPEGILVKSLVLASVVELDTDIESYLVLVRSVDPHERILSRSTPDVNEAWTDVYSWGVYESAGPHGEHCRNLFGGFVQTSPEPTSPSTSGPNRNQPLGANVAFWLMLVLVIAVRCESEVVGSPFLLETN